MAAAVDISDLSAEELRAYVDANAYTHDFVIALAERIGRQERTIRELFGDVVRLSMQSDVV